MIYESNSLILSKIRLWRDMSRGKVTDLRPGFGQGRDGIVCTCNNACRWQRISERPINVRFTRFVKYKDLITMAFVALNCSGSF